MEDLKCTLLINTDNNQIDVAQLVINSECHLSPMPIGVTVTVENGRIISLWSQVKISYDGHGRHDNADYRLDYAPIPGTQERLLDINAQGLRGGLRYHQAFARTRSNTGYEENHSSTIRTLPIIATQPSGNIIRSFIHDTPFWLLSYLKSKFQLFSLEGIPLFDNGFGLWRDIEIDPSAIWNWKLNATTLYASFTGRKEKVKNMPEVLRQSNPDLYRRVPDFTEAELKMECWQSYGQGIYYKAVKTSWLFNKWGWVATHENDGLADRLQQLQKQIEIGTLPPNWE